MLTFDKLDFSVKCPLREFGVRASGLRQKVYSGSWFSGNRHITPGKHKYTMTKHSVSYPEATSSTSHKDYNTFANIPVRFSQPENPRPFENFGQCKVCGFKYRV